MNATTPPLSDRIKVEIEALVLEARDLLGHVQEQEPANILPFTRLYQTWYTRSLAVANTSEAILGYLEAAEKEGIPVP